MVIGVPREAFPGERRVALVPSVVAQLVKGKWEVRFQAGAGDAAGFLDREYEQAGAAVVASRQEAFAADVVLQVRAYGADPEGWETDLGWCREGQVVIGMMDPLSAPLPLGTAARRGITAFALELVPRITRAQAMDVLSSQANLAGYKAVLLAADALPKIFPMMTTAAGTIVPARVFVIGAGVAGLQAIATARRLGAVVSAYDVRAAVKEQVESVGARFVEVDLSTQGAEGSGGYAAAMDAAFYQRQAELLTPVMAENDVAITTAAIPGQRAPILITRGMVEAMRPGSVIVDLAAERGGNCELTRPGETFSHGGVTVMGPLNLPSTLPYHASRLYAKNIATFLTHIGKSGEVQIDLEDPITKDTLVAWRGDVVNVRVRQKLGMAQLAPDA